MAQNQIQRLKKRSDFVALRDTQQKGIAKAIVVQARKTSDDAPLRIGFTVTKKQGNAVKRNRIKRRLREAARLLFQQKHAPGHDVVVIARNDALTRDFELLKGDLLYCLKKAEVPVQSHSK